MSASSSSKRLKVLAGFAVALIVLAVGIFLYAHGHALATRSYEESIEEEAERLANSHQLTWISEIEIGQSWTRLSVAQNIRIFEKLDKNTLDVGSHSADASALTIFARKSAEGRYAFKVKYTPPR